MSKANEIASARELAKELVPFLETMVNIHYLLKKNPAPPRVRELLRSEWIVIETVLERLQRELKGKDGYGG
jgi:hypothetical protein